MREIGKYFEEHCKQYSRMAAPGERHNIGNCWKYAWALQISIHFNIALRWHLNVNTEIATLVQLISHLKWGRGVERFCHKMITEQNNYGMFLYQIMSSYLMDLEDWTKNSVRGTQCIRQHLWGGMDSWLFRSVPFFSLNVAKQNFVCPFPPQMLGDLASPSSTSLPNSSSCSYVLCLDLNGWCRCGHVYATLGSPIKHALTITFLLIFCS